MQPTQQGDLKKALQYASRNPSSDFAKQLGQTIASGQVDGQAQQLGIDLTPIKSYFASTVPKPVQSNSSYGEKVGQEQSAGVQKIGASISKGAQDIALGSEQQNSPDFSTKIKGVGNVIKGGAESAFGTISGAAQTFFAPITPAIKTVIQRGIDNNPDFANSPAGKLVNYLGPKLDEFAQAHPDAATLTGDILNTALLAVGGNPLEAVGKDALKGALTKEALSTAKNDLVGAVKNIPNTITNVADAGFNAVDKVKSLATKAPQAAKELAIPTIKPEEAVGKIIQGTTEDVPVAQRALSEIDTNGVKTYKQLQSKISDKIKEIAPQVDKQLAQDTVGKSIKSFEQTVGEGKSAVRVNPVTQALDDLRTFYEKTNNASGLSKIKSIENNAKIKGMTYKDVNDLAKLHGRELNAYNASNELATGLTKQAAENTRKGLKAVARQGLGGPEAQALDAKLSDLYDLQTLVDKQVENVNKSVQKAPKTNKLQQGVRTAVKVADTLTGNPLKAIGREIGATSGSLTPVEMEAQLAKLLKSLKK